MSSQSVFKTECSGSSISVLGEGIFTLRKPFQVEPAQHLIMAAFFLCQVCPLHFYLVEAENDSVRQDSKIGVAAGTRLDGALRGPVTAFPLLNSLREVFRLRSFLLLTGIFAAVSTANWIAYAWLPLHLYERLHMTLASAGFTATFYVQVGAFAGILLGGVIGDRWIIRSPRGRVWTQALGLAAAVPFLFVVGGISSRPFLLASLIVFGIGRGTFDSNAMPTLCQIAPPSLRATGYGIFNCAGCIAGGLMTVAAGWIKAHVGLSVAFQFAAVMWIASAVTLACMRALPADAECYAAL